MKKLFLFFFISFWGFNLQSQSLESDTVDVLNYDINLDIIHLSKRKITGFTELIIVPKINNLNRLKLDLLHLDIDSVIIDNQNKSFNYNDTLLTINLQQTYSQIDTITARIYYNGQPVTDPTGWGGFYFSSDSLYAFNLGVGFGDNPHNYGRAFFPCLDDFHDRATYNFRIKTKIDKMAVCNGTLQSSSTDTISGISEYYWRLHSSIPTYLASIAIGPYVALLDTFHGQEADIPIGIYVPQNKVAAVNGSFLRLHQILEAYEWAYGPYQWERIGYVAVPFNSGAMEHSTNIALGLAYINGLNTYESLIAHELSHQWFGNLVTTNSAPEMWINEGWAVYSENLYKEKLDGKSLARNEMRTLLKNVLLSAHIDDGGYWSLDNLPHDVTYGSTAYDKGATVAHSIRGYLGDSLFFLMLKDYFNQNAFSYISNNNFRDFITNSTGISMSGFFDAWVFQPGFTHFSVDSFSVQSAGNKHLVKINLRQKLRHKNIPAVNNRITVRFANDSWQFADRILEFSGISGLDTAILNFVPTKIFVDPDGVLADATTDYFEIIKTTGAKNYTDSYFKLDVKQIADSALLQVTHNWVAPDTQGTNLPGLYFNTKRYWTVEGIFPAGFNATGQFFYSRTPEFDADILQVANDSLVILYRKGAGLPWQSVDFTKQGIWSTGWVNVPNLQPGEYTIAVWDEIYANLKPAPSNNASLKVFPNPISENSVIDISYAGNWTLKISDNHGKLLITYRGIGKNKKLIDRSVLQNSGLYFVFLLGENGQLLKTEKLVLIK
jgi:hypothetical protein